MKKLSFSLVAMMIATVNYAQSNLVATLSHNGEVSVFHGANSLKDAMVAADHGDIITLASGRYNATDITKAITLRGAGIEADDTGTGAARTEIVGNFYFAITIPDSINKHLTLEGIYHDGEIHLNGNPHTLNNSILQKCRFRYIAFSANAQVNSMTCIHCNISERIILPRFQSSTAKFINCVISSPESSDKGHNGSMEFTNCIILGALDRTHNSYYQNCILNGSGSLQSTNMASSCAGYTSNDNGSPFARLSTQATNKVLTQEQINALFKPDTFYELTDEAKAEYVGIDNKEMGIYGGNLPYETNILSPQITKCNVAAKTTADGKLSVDIEVRAAE